MLQELGDAGLAIQGWLRYVERLRAQLARMRDDVERVLRRYATPSVTVGVGLVPRRKLYMSEMIDDIARVRRRS